MLGSRGKNETLRTSTRTETLTIRTDITPEIGQRLPSLSPPDEAHSEYSSSSAPKTPSAQSALQQTPPPTPVAKSPRHTLSPLSVCPPRPPSQLSNPHSQSKSPSIANLGTLSVVTQRLAQIEGSELASPASSAISSSSVGTALRRAQAIRPTHRDRPFAEIERLQEENGAENFSRAVEAPLTDDSIVIPLLDPPPSDVISVRSAFRRDRAKPRSSPAPPNSPAKAPPSTAAVATLRAELSEPAIREHVENPPTSPLAVGVEPHLAPLAELIKDTAAKHYDQTAGLGEQIISLQRDIHVLPNEIQVLLEQVMTAAAERASDANAHADNASLQKVLTSFEGLKRLILVNSEHPQMDSLMRMFGDLQTRLSALAPLLMEKLVSIEQGQTQLQIQATQEAARSMRDVPPSPRSSSQTGVGNRFQDGSHHASVDLSDIHSKLDELACLCRSSAATISTANIPSSQTADADSEKVC